MAGGDWKEFFNAAVEGDLALVEHHVAGGVDIDYAHPEFLSTPLVAAILAGQAAVAMRLLDHGASAVLGSEFDACTPVQAARRMGLQALEDRLVALGAPRPSAPTPRDAAGLRRRIGRLFGRLFGRRSA